MNGNGHRSLGDTFRAAREETAALSGEAQDIAAEVRALMRLEIALARAEASEAAKHGLWSIGLGLAASALGLIASTFFFLAVMFALDTAMPLWLAALLTTLVIAVTAGGLAAIARGHARAFSPLPRRFLRSLREDLEWARTQMQSIGR